MFHFLLLISSTAVHAVIHTEGGSFVRDADQPAPYISGDKNGIDYGEDVIELQPARSPTGQRHLANIVDELSRAYNNEREEEAVPLELLIAAAKQQRDAALAKEPPVNYLGLYPPPAESAGRDPNEEEIAELRKFGSKFRELQHPTGPVLPEYEPQAVEIDESTSESEQQAAIPKKQIPKKEKPLTAKKKEFGQSEFVEFVDPRHVVSNKLKNREFMEKRVADGTRLRDDYDDSVLGLISASGNVLFIAFITMCCALTVVGVVGGTYYYKHVHPDREDPFDDFTRYSPAGPGKQFKRGLGNFTSEKGDETLAYRAQLHHYQQTKQKIIGSGDETLGSPGLGAGGLTVRGGGGTIDDDTDKSEDEGELEHNYSVYECPGLAPTGDIEVQNPNFVDNAGGASGKHHRVKSPQSPERRA